TVRTDNAKEWSFFEVGDKYARFKICRPHLKVYNCTLLKWNSTHWEQHISQSQGSLKDECDDMNNSKRHYKFYQFSPHSEYTPRVYSSPSDHPLFNVIKNDALKYTLEFKFPDRVKDHRSCILNDIQGIRMELRLENHDRIASDKHSALEANLIYHLTAWYLNSQGEYTENAFRSVSFGSGPVLKQKIPLVPQQPCFYQTECDQCAQEGTQIFLVLLIVSMTFNIALIPISCYASRFCVKSNSQVPLNDHSLQTAPHILRPITQRRHFISSIGSSNQSSHPYEEIDHFGKRPLLSVGPNESKIEGSLIQDNEAAKFRTGPEQDQ
ncbi:hypothetical protein TCAL_08652, partial [Tigriopus californicus]